MFKHLNWFSGIREIPRVLTDGVGRDIHGVAGIKLL